ncbi:MAG: hypothetical protein JST00_27550 [Deltaproteobacteria bacterium]|nr:hypothetical protein [Deltaproteobacteria bacterium]
MRVRIGAVAVFTIASASCSLLVSTSGLSDGDASSSNDAGRDGASDAAVVDASSDAVGADAEGGEGGGDGGTVPGLLDDFARPDSLTVGNKWVEKSPDVFRILGGRLLSEATPNSYRDALCLRPSSEDVLDVEVSVDIVVNAANVYPTLVVRSRPASAQADTLRAYLFFVSALATVGMTRENGTPGTVGASVLGAGESISPPLELGVAYRMTFRVTGTSTVDLRGKIVRKSDGIVVNTSTGSDAIPTAIVEPGSVGVACDKGGAAFDDFARLSL